MPPESWFIVLAGVVLGAIIIRVAREAADHELRNFLRPPDPKHTKDEDDALTRGQLRRAGWALQIKAHGPLVITVTPLLILIGFLQAEFQFFTKAGTQGVLAGIVLLGVFVNALHDAIKDGSTRVPALLWAALQRVTHEGTPQRTRLNQRRPWIAGDDPGERQNALYIVRATPTPPERPTPRPPEIGTGDAPRFTARTASQPDVPAATPGGLEPDSQPSPRSAPETRHSG